MELLEVACFVASLCKLVHDLINSYSLLSHHYKQMIDKIGNFKNGFLIVTVFGSNNCFAAFLADLFQYLVKTLFKKVTGI